MQDSEELEAIFFKAQETEDASQRARLFSQITSAVATDDPGRIVSSAAHNSLAELKIDEAMALGFPMTAHDDATVLEARRLLRQALKLWPENAQAAMSLALTLTRPPTLTLALTLTLTMSLTLFLTMSLNLTLTRPP